MKQTVMKENKSILERLLYVAFKNQNNDIRAVRYGLYAFYSFFSGDYNPLRDFKASFNFASHAPKSISLLKKIFMHINKIDDEIDILSPSEIIKKFSNTKLGQTTPGIFTQDFCPKNLFSTVQKIIKNRLASEKEIFSFFNLFSFHILQEATMARALEKTGNIKYRQNMVEEHLKLTDASGAFVLNFFVRDRHIRNLIKNGQPLDHTSISARFNNLCKLCRLTQYKDDFLDLYKDMRSEEVLKRVTPNTVILTLHEENMFKENKKHIKEFYTQISSEKERLPISQLPTGLKKASEIMLNKYKEESETFPLAIKSVLLADINRTVEDGVYITTNGDIKDEDTKWGERFINNKPKL